ncbi:MAG TPA: hypothetical protein IGS53_17530 [Leptolyngbyaceae cyanobacterium M33_DOE_097]|uniref:Uncharacterized protein n=1 Tax=Oscillatoriales cyanobacterium SpSt-418 TaxID=2282169 RepID=A0A7C3KFH7_9CYAN|nr:hypothetical protein [Leptolyngbyaceae cyanobacterium M33_DOE_097]
MLRPESYYTELASYQSSATSEKQSARQTRRKQVLDQASEIDALVAALVPDDVSANKRAIVRHLIACWVDEQASQAS